LAKVVGFGRIELAYDKPVVGLWDEVTFIDEIRIRAELFHSSSLKGNCLPSRSMKGGAKT
jgi:hypothetical protein